MLPTVRISTVLTRPKGVLLQVLKPISTPLPLFQRRKFSLREDVIKTAPSSPKPSQDPGLKQDQIVPLPATDTRSLSILDNGRLEKFIPVTRRTLLRMIVEDKELLDSYQKKLMEKVAAAMDTKYSNRFYSILEQAKVSCYFDLYVIQQREIPHPLLSN